MESLQPGAEHRSIDLAQQSSGDVHDAIRVDAEQITIEGEVVDRAQREPVDDSGDAFRLDIRDDVRRLDQLPLAAVGEAGERLNELLHPGTAVTLPSVASERYGDSATPNEFAPMNFGDPCS